MELPQGQNPAGIRTQGSQTPDGLCPPVDSGWVISTPWHCRDGLCQEWQHQSCLAQLPGVSWIPFPAQGHSLGAGSQPAPPLTAPPQGRPCLSSPHGIPGGARQPRASPCRIPKELCEKPVLQTGSKSILPVPSEGLGVQWGFGVGVRSSDPGTNPFLQGRVGGRNGNDGQEKNDKKVTTEAFCGELSWKNHLSAASAALEAQKIPIISTSVKG